MVSTSPWAGLGNWMARHARVIQSLQWVMVAVYAVLVTAPAFLPLPDDSKRLADDMVLFAQFAFWGLWWPLVMISMLLGGRAWCGLFCPEGTLTEWASRHGLGLAIPRWLRWRGWPLAAFVMTTVYGQMITVYEYPKAALLVLGGSTVAAVAVGFVYGKGLRVWCRYLCPASGVFALLSRLAPLRFGVNPQAWREAPRTHAVTCAPLVEVRALSGGGACHMCGRCSGHREAVSLETCLPGATVLDMPEREVQAWEILLLLFGVLGVATGAFLWSASPWYIVFKQGAAAWLVDHGILFPLTTELPWWILTNSEETGEVFSLLDGICLLGFIGAVALFLGVMGLAGLNLAHRLSGKSTSLWRLGYGLIPSGAMGLITGLSALTLTQLSAEGIILPWAASARLGLLVLGLAWSAVLIWRLLPTRRLSALPFALAGPLAHAALWGLALLVW